jgi:hypothetical protein
MAQEVVQEEQSGGTSLPPSTPEVVLEGDTSTSIEDVEDQLQYLLQHTVRRRSHNISGLPSKEESRVKIAEDDSVRGMGLAKLDLKYHELKSKILGEGKHWWTFSDVAPTWEENVQKVFNGEISGEQNLSIAHTLLHDGARCIMGESWGGSGWGHCTDCGWLGGAGLNMFCNGNDLIDRTRPNGYNDYKMKYEYHWNKYHYDIGATMSKTPQGGIEQRFQM